MLKAQSKAKISQWSSDWQNKEDLLTGDFFGALDYLPRDPFLREFIETIGLLNPDVALPLEDVDWEGIELEFWPRESAEGDATEPDLVILSNRWVIVVEVKLGSGLGVRQPWRELLVGRRLANQRGLPPSAAFHLLVTRSHENAEATFTGDDSARYPEFKNVALQLRWFEAYGLVKRWLTNGPRGCSLAAEQERLLQDLLESMRKRRGLSFTGFRFHQLEMACADMSPAFCPSRFLGFVAGNEPVRHEPVFFIGLGSFAGFLLGAPRVKAESTESSGFQGFCTRIDPVGQAPASYFFGSRFNGFANNTRPCQQLRAWEIEEHA